MLIHHHSCPLLQFWDAGPTEAHCECPAGWPKDTDDMSRSVARRLAAQQEKPAPTFDRERGDG